LPQKVFIDTNILLNENFRFEDYDKVEISITSIEENDGLKNDETIGYKSRYATNKMMRATNMRTKIYYETSFENRFLPHKNDNTILGFAWQTYQDNKEFVFLCDDYNLFLKSEAIGLPCELFAYKDTTKDSYQGIREVWLTDSEKKILLDSEINLLDLSPNEYVIINNNVNDKQLLYTWNGVYFEEVETRAISNKYEYEIFPLDLYQKALMHMLQNDNVKIKVTDSVYGSGKSYLMIHWALQQLEKGDKYNKLLFIKSDSPPKGRKEFPAIPGGVLDKVAPLLGVICDTTSEDSITDILTRNNMLEILPIQFARGRSLKNTIVFINECQNFTPSEMELLLSRIGENTVVLIDGSTMQIDNKYCSHKNGLTSVSNNFRDKSIASQVNMIEDFRSDISKMVSAMDWSD